MFERRPVNERKHADFQRCINECRSSKLYEFDLVSWCVKLSEVQLYIQLAAHTCGSRCMTETHGFCTGCLRSCLAGLCVRLDAASSRAELPSHLAHDASTFGLVSATPSTCFKIRIKACINQ